MSKKEFISKRPWQEYLFYGTMLFICLFIAYQLPYTFDDWDWGLDRVGLVHFLTGDVNSRYVGNFFEVIMTRSRMAKTLIIGVVSFFIPIMISVVVSEISGSNRNRISITSAAFVMIALIDFNVLQQTYIWVAGFANYVISMLLLLVFIYFFISSKDYDTVKCVLIGLLSLALQLFLENLTLCVLLLAMIGVVIYRKKKYICMTVGAAVGTAIMFSSSIYPELYKYGQTSNGVRSVTFDSSLPFTDIVKNLIRTYTVENFFGRVISTSVVICVIISAFYIYKIAKSKDMSLSSRMWYSVLIAFVGFMLVVRKTTDYDKYIGPLWYVVSFVLIGTLVENKRQRNIMFGFLAFAQLLVVPLAAVGGWSSRNYLTSDILLIVVACYLLNNALETIDFKQAMQKILPALLSLCIMAVYAPALVIYSSIGKIDRERYQIIANTDFEQDSSLSLPAFEYEEYLWNPTPYEEYSKPFFKEFYGIPDNVTIYIGDDSEGF